MIKKLLKRYKKQVYKIGGFLIPDDKTYLKINFRLKVGRKLDLKQPIFYNDKLQWLKLYNRKPEYTVMVDKHQVKELVAKRIGEEYLIPTLGLWNKFDDIDFSTLPNQFVLKCTHDSGGLVICKDKSKLNINEVKKKINSCMKMDFYYEGREWPYKNVKPRIIAEKFMVDESGTELKDYKFFCFNGVAKMLYVATDRPFNTHFDFFDLNFKHLPIHQSHSWADKEIVKPKNFEEMIKIAEKLSQGYPHVRVDLYNINGKIYFGEYTFFHESGLSRIEPIEWDKKIGDWLDLSTIKS